MVTTTMPPPLVKLDLPTREEIRAMLHTTAVAITVVICGCLVFLAALAGVVFLAYTGHDSAAIGALFTVVLAAIGARMSGQIQQARREIQEVKSQQANQDS